MFETAYGLEATRPVQVLDLAEPDRRYLAIKRPSVGAVLHRVETSQPVDFHHWLFLASQWEMDRQGRLLGAFGRRRYPVELCWVDPVVLVRVGRQLKTGETISVYPYTPPPTPEGMAEDALRFVSDWIRDQGLSHEVTCILVDMARSRNWAATNLRYQKRRKVSSETSFSPRAFLLLARLAAARDLLVVHPGATVAQVAQACGWVSGSAFSRTFGQTFGVTPGRYRDKVA